MEKMWKKFPELVTAVTEDHKNEGHKDRSHDLLHALMVAQYGTMIAGTKSEKKCAWVAGLCHNTDRIFPEDQVGKIVSRYLSETSLTREEKEAVHEAVMKHSEPNKKSDNPITVALKDADRLANLGPLTLIRSGQFRSGIRTANPKHITNPDPEAAYLEPKSAFHDAIHTRLEWESWLRLPKAKELGKELFAYHKQAIKCTEHQLQKIDLSPWPEELILEND
jgi:hypothetical protein